MCKAGGREKERQKSLPLFSKISAYILVSGDWGETDNNQNKYMLEDVSGKREKQSREGWGEGGCVHVPCIFLPETVTLE